MKKHKKNKGNPKTAGKFDVVGIELDGNKSYISVYKNNGKFIYPLQKRKDADSIAKFVSFKVAKIAAEAMLGKQSKFEYHLVIKGKDYMLSDAMYVNGYYQLYDQEKMIKYYIKERLIRRIAWIGYIGIDNGLYERKDKSYGLGRSKALFEAIEKQSYQYLFDNEENGIMEIEKLPAKEYVLTVKNSTAKIHIMGNSKIMDLNQKRKEYRERCIPFDKEVDKFLTAFVYVTVDQSEYKFVNSPFKGKNAVMNLIERIKGVEGFESIEYKEVPFVGQIYDNMR